MKKLFWMLSIALMPMVALTSCSDDDDNSLAGSVKGTCGVFLNAEGLGIVNSTGTIKLRKTGDATVSLKLENFVFGEGSIEGVAISAATLTGTKGNIAISSIEETMTVKVGELTAEGVKVQITSGTIKSKKDVLLTISVKIPGLGDHIISATSNKVLPSAR